MNLEKNHAHCAWRGFRRLADLKYSRFLILWSVLLVPYRYLYLTFYFILALQLLCTRFWWQIFWTSSWFIMLIVIGQPPLCLGASPGPYQRGPLYNTFRFTRTRTSRYSVTMRPQREAWPAPARFLAWERAWNHHVPALQVRRVYRESEAWLPRERGLVAAHAR